MILPQKPLLDAVYRILRNLKSELGKKLLYTKHDNLNVRIFIDADWAGRKTDKRSTIVDCTFVGGNPVTWKSVKQLLVARSSAEAGYWAMAHGFHEALWLRSLLTDLGFKVEIPMCLYGDSQATLFISENPVFHQSIKHIEVDCHFLRKKIA